MNALPSRDAAPAAQTTALPNVHLGAFEGPLDMLLHLIRSREMDVFDIPIAELTDQYLQTLKSGGDPDLELAGDYLVMASSLMQIKSRMLLPRPEQDEHGNEIDPRAELVAQLLAYEQYRALSEEIGKRPMVGRDVFLRSVFPESDMVERPQAEADLDALLVAFRNVLKRVGGKVEHHVFMNTMSVREQMSRVLERLGRGSILFEELAQKQGDRELLVTMFLAVLELWREKRIKLVQNRCYDSISLLPA